MSPFSNRYGSEQMRFLFSDNFKYSIWCELWFNLMVVQKNNGVISITKQQIKQLNEVNNVEILTRIINRAQELESTTHHEVVAFINALCEFCPEAAPVIHLGATSSFITDNHELIRMKRAITQITHMLKRIITIMLHSAEEYDSLICVGYTHLQRAQLTTYGMRIAGWTYSLMLALWELESVQLKFLGCRGPVGSGVTMAEVLTIKQMDEIDRQLARVFGFNGVYLCTGQTYPRGEDIKVISALAMVGAAAAKIAGDVRQLQAFGEVQECFNDGQVGSSAMPYKRNPINSEKICGLARYVSSLMGNVLWTASEQRLERTLDDTSNRRVVIPEAFLAIDEIMNTLYDVVKGLQIDVFVVESHAREHALLAATENTIAHGAAIGALDRNAVHNSVVDCPINAYGQYNNSKIEKVCSIEEISAYRVEQVKLEWERRGNN